MKVFELVNGEIKVKTFCTVETAATYLAADGTKIFRKIDENRIIVKHGNYTMFSNTADANYFKRAIIKALESKKVKILNQYREITEEQKAIKQIYTGGVQS